MQRKRLPFSGFQARAELVEMVRVDQVQLMLDAFLARLTKLQDNHMAAGRVSHASGVRTAINALDQICRDAWCPAVVQTPAPPLALEDPAPTN